MTRNIVYFLGAGCSHNFGYPLTGQIMPMIMERLRKHDLFQLYKKRKTPLERKLETELLHFLYKLYPGLKYSKKAKKPETVVPNITDILSLVEHFYFYNLPPHPKIADEQLLRFRELLNRAVVELILECDMKTMKKDEEELFYKLIDPVRHKRRGDKNKISFITTNYDLLLDWEFSDIMAKNKVDFGINYRNVKSSELIFRNPKPRFQYYKLHGSLNWLRCELCGQYYINTNGSIAALAFENKLSKINTCICNCNIRLKNVLVTPSIVRDIRDANLLQIWKAALEAIRTADKLIFIGYSLPAEDLAIKSIIMRGINGRKRGRRLEIDVVQLGSDSKPNYKNIFGRNINFYKKGLPEYLK